MAFHTFQIQPVTLIPLFIRWFGHMVLEGVLERIVLFAEIPMELVEQQLRNANSGRTTCDFGNTIWRLNFHQEFV